MITVIATTLVLVNTYELSPEESSVIEELRSEGLSEVDIDLILEEYNTQELQESEDLSPPGDSNQRGGPIRRRRPGGRRRQSLFRFLMDRLSARRRLRPRPNARPRPQYRPSYQKPKPSYNKPKPSYQKPKLSYQKYKPSYSHKKPKPSYQKPKPSYNKPKPSYQKPEPSYNKPKPSYQKPKPSYNEPKPSYNKPSHQSASHDISQDPVEPFDEFTAPESPTSSTATYEATSSYKPVTVRPTYSPTRIPTLTTSVSDPFIYEQVSPSTTSPPSYPAPSYINPSTAYKPPTTSSSNSYEFKFPPFPFASLEREKFFDSFQSKLDYVLLKCT